MRIISLFLVICLLLPISPNVSLAQLLPTTLGTTLSTPSPNAPTLTSAKSTLGVVITDSYVLGPGDQLEVHLVVGDNALVMDYNFTINPQGKIFFPNLSEMTLGGLTLKEARSLMFKEIKKKYPERFDLSVMVSTPKMIGVFITGQVDNPGLRIVYDGTRISEVLKEAGVAKGGSDYTDVVYVRRKTKEGKDETLKLSLYDVFLGNDNQQNVVLRNGDIISVPSMKSYVYVYGEVARSGTYGYVPGQTLADYLNLAGGPAPRANLAACTVTRQENGKPKVYYVNASDILQKGMISKDLEIQPGDVISVPANFFYFSDFASFANTILLALTLYTSLVKR
ncbi:MAG: polysaccharide biosynthesis/export family protein [Candidatus Margulisiibacteriota bacterium]